MTTEIDKISPSEMIGIAAINKFFGGSEYLQWVGNQVNDGRIEVVANPDSNAKLMYYARGGAVIISVPEHELGKLGAIGYKSVLAKILKDYVEEKNYCKLTAGQESGCAFCVPIMILGAYPCSVILEGAYNINNMVGHGTVIALCLAIVATVRGLNKLFKDEYEQKYCKAMDYLSLLQTTEFEEEGQKLSWVQKTTADKLFEEAINYSQQSWEVDGEPPAPCRSFSEGW